MKVHFNVGCLATYTCCLDVPEENCETTGDILEYLRDHLDECPVGDDLEWLEDLPLDSAITEADIRLPSLI